MLEVKDISYIAGFFDGEGYLTIRRSNYTKAKNQLIADNQNLLDRMDRTIKDLAIRIQLYGDWVSPAIQSIRKANEILIRGLQKQLTPQQINTALNQELSTLETAMMVCQSKEDYQGILNLTKKRIDTAGNAVSAKEEVKAG